MTIIMRPTGYLNSSLLTPSNVSTYYPPINNNETSTLGYTIDSSVLNTNVQPSLISNTLPSNDYTSIVNDNYETEEPETNDRPKKPFQTNTILIAGFGVLALLILLKNK